MNIDLLVKYGERNEVRTPLNLLLQSPHFGIDPLFPGYKYTNLPPGVLELINKIHNTNNYYNNNGHSHFPSVRFSIVR